MFRHGVASGDPTSSAVILWTRVSPGRPGPVAVDWEVATEPDFKRPVRFGTLTTSEARDFTVKVDVDRLAPRENYFYRFRCQSRTSVVGRTRTAPEGTSLNESGSALRRVRITRADIFTAIESSSTLTSMPSCIWATTSTTTVSQRTRSWVGLMHHRAACRRCPIIDSATPSTGWTSTWLRCIAFTRSSRCGMTMSSPTTHGPMARQHIWSR